MVNYYFLIINKDDYYRYGLFLAGFLKYSEYKIWGQLKSTANDLWETINENDVVIFGNEDFHFKNYSKVIKKSIVTTTQAQSLFGNSFRSKELKYLLHFDTIYDSKFTYSEMKREVGLHINPSHGFFKVPPTSKKSFIKKFSVNDLGSSKSFVIEPVNPDGNPDKKIKQTTVFDRNTTIVKKLKKQYGNSCQVCGYRIKKADGTFYSEVHHFWPLKLGGDDNKQNMLVLCPNHHNEFEFCALALLEDGISVVNCKNKVVFTLKLLSGHSIHDKNINFHMSRFNQN
jgi:predicted HNH restriction endonuclease